MSFVPAPQQANVASANKSSNNEVAVKSNNAAAAAAEDPVNEDELIFKIRTFDVYWVDKYALMYKAGVDKVRCNYLFIVLDVVGVNS
jgi:ATP-dependent RNA helicase DDX60